MIFMKIRACNRFVQGSRGDPEAVIVNLLIRELNTIAVSSAYLLHELFSSPEILTPVLPPYSSTVSVGTHCEYFRYFPHCVF